MVLVDSTNLMRSGPQAKNDGRAMTYCSGFVKRENVTSNQHNFCHLECLRMKF